jgi:1,4-alpha-glucan branching enzyme
VSSHSPACEKSPDSEIYIDQLHLNTLEWFWRDVKTNNTWEELDIYEVHAGIPSVSDSENVSRCLPFSAVLFFVMF